MAVKIDDNWNGLRRELKRRVAQDRHRADEYQREYGVADNPLLRTVNCRANALKSVITLMDAMEGVPETDVDAL